VPLTYRPVAAETLGQGRWRVSTQTIRANTFEFSDIIKDHLARDTSGRLGVDRALVKQVALSMPNEPLVFFFDGEVQRTELAFRYGATPSLDLSLVLGWQSVDGGCLDGLIEDFHKLGIYQTGRNAIARNQLTMAVIQQGKMVLFAQEAMQNRPVDPVLSLVQRLYEEQGFTLSLIGALQIPATRFAGTYKSLWDSSAGLVFQWRPFPNQSFNGGGAYLRRTTKPFEGVAPFLIKDQIAGHLGWQWEGWRRVRPYFLLLYHDSLTSHGPGATLDKPSLNHDLGVHVRLGPRTVLTFGYINNITHNENTADMALELRLAVSF
jgi:hypothetical protein